MEVCGGQTHAIARWGLERLLPPGLRLLHGPGCPVCVTPASTLETALALALEPGVTLATYGDMLRVPAGAALAPGVPAPSLQTVRAAGGTVQILTSPLQALALAEANPHRQVVWLAVGFETTAPATALLIRQAWERGIGNLSILNAHVRVGPAMALIGADPASRVQGFLAAGHVAAVLGTEELESLERRRQPVVVSGFTAEALLRGVLACVALLERAAGAGDRSPGVVANAYPQVVRPGGNPRAQALLAEVFEPADGVWRGLGLIPSGVLALRPPYRSLEARQRFGLLEPKASEEACSSWCPTTQPESCRSGAVLRGQLRPDDCPSFGKACTPLTPLGAPMVSSEGACAAYYRYRGPGRVEPLP